MSTAHVENVEYGRCISAGYERRVKGGCRMGAWRTFHAKGTETEITSIDADTF